MRRFTYSKCIIVIGIFVAGGWCLQLAGSRAQPPGAARSTARSTAGPGGSFDPLTAPGPGSEGMMPGGAPGPSNAAVHAFALVKSDGSVENHTATRLYVYQLSPGAAKPKRTDLSNAPRLAGSGGDYGGGYGGDMMGMSGMSGYGGDSMGSMGSGMTMGATASRAAAGNGAGEGGPTWVWAYVFDEPIDPNAQQEFKPLRAEVKIVVPVASSTAAEGGGYSSGSPGFADMGMGMADAPIPTWQLLENPPQASAASPAPWSELAPRGSKAELKIIAQLVRHDIWIRDAHSQLKAKRSQATEFAALEKHLKALLDEDYEAQLVKQRNDVSKLREKLDRLQADLERRAQAKDRVVNVQLGQLVLDAQGLLNQ